jgi:hypothetical protein
MNALFEMNSEFCIGAPTQIRKIKENFSEELTPDVGSKLCNHSEVSSAERDLC